MNLETALLTVTVVAVAVWEALRPARPMMAPMALRWFGNFAVFGMGWAVLFFLPLLAGIGAAAFARQYGIGLFNLVAIPGWAAFGLGIVLLDLSGYWQHRLLHLRPFWRLHALHHSDTDLDVSTAIRHHPLEILVTAAMDSAVALACGIPPEAIVFYGGVTTLVQFVHHGNVELPKALNGLRVAIVTPAFHRLHHSILYDENNANFSNLCPIWDRLFGTERRDPRGDLRLGLEEFPGERYQRLDRMLLSPLLIGPPARPPERQTAQE